MKVNLERTFYKAQMIKRYEQYLNNTKDKLKCLDKNVKNSYYFTKVRVLKN